MLVRSRILYTRVRNISPYTYHKYLQRQEKSKSSEVEIALSIELFRFVVGFITVVMVHAAVAVGFG